MSAGYSGDPSTSDDDHLRFILGDRQEPLFFSPEEITHLLAEAGANVLKAGIAGCGVLAAHYMQRIDTTVGKVQVSYTQAFENIMKVQRKLEDRQKKTQSMEGLQLGHWDTCLGKARTEPLFDYGMNDNQRADSFYDDGVGLTDVE